MILVDWQANWTASTFPLATLTPCRVECLPKSTKKMQQGVPPLASKVLATVKKAWEEIGE